MKKRILSLFLAFTITCSFLCSSAFAMEQSADVINYIYADSIEDVDLASLSPTDVIVIPNSESPSVPTSHSLTPTPDYLNSFEATPYGTSAPNITTIWNIANKGRYDFEGYTSSWSNTYLYTDYYLTGSDQYWVAIYNNRNDASVTASLHGWIYTYKTVEIPAGSSCHFLFDSDTANHTVSASTDWYIKFMNPDSESNACSVYGYVIEY